ncbi:glycosyltransferase family 2 protein [Patescibacteria group bacterium]|nr:glycosyltransferase family 2 protein [Patescibacteria group bacterium]
MTEISLVSVVIPCFNDGPRITPVVNEVKKSNYCREIIVVDDGSDQETNHILRSLTGIKLIRHPRNLGKSRALKSGILQVKSPYVAFVDSDLTHFTTANFDKLVSPVINRQCDITLGIREKEDWYGVISGFALAYTGERCLSTKLLRQNIDIFDQKGYLIEPEFNQRFFHHVKVRGVLLKNVGQLSQPRKNGFRGLLINFRQVQSFIKCYGINQVYRQILFVKNPHFLLY